MTIPAFDQKLQSIQETLSQPIRYEGGNNLDEVITYLDQIHTRLQPVIFEGSGVEPGSAMLEKGKQSATLLFSQNNAQLMNLLRQGTIYEAMSLALIEERHRQETGTRYCNEMLGVDIPIAYNANAPAPIGVARYQDNAELTLFLNNLGVVFYDHKQKNASFSHEGAHIALGHTDLPTPPQDRRKIEFDADHVGALAENDRENTLSALVADRTIERKLPPVEISEEQFSRLRAQAYARLGVNPGDNPEIDSSLERAREAAAQASKIIYPKSSERIEEISALDRQLKYQDELLHCVDTLLGAGSYEAQRSEIQKERVKEAIETRHIKHSKNTPTR